MTAGRVVEYMKDDISESVAVDDLTRTALFSEFHSTCVTGISPSRFRSAVQLQRAEQLLLATSLSVAGLHYQHLGRLAVRDRTRPVMGGLA
jgi:AraC family transcriptional regulator